MNRYERTDVDTAARPDEQVVPSVWGGALTAAYMRCIAPRRAESGRVRSKLSQGYASVFSTFFDRNRSSTVTELTTVAGRGSAFIRSDRVAVPPAGGGPAGITRTLLRPYVYAEAHYRARACPGRPIGRRSANQ